MTTMTSEPLPAKVLTIDFSKADSIRQHGTGIVRHRTSDSRPTDADGKLLTPKQIRARARRRAVNNRKKTKELLSTEEFNALYKPIDEWDLEELAHGRPRNSKGNFAGPKPKWITRQVHERAMEQFQLAIKTQMNSLTPDALTTLQWVMNSDETDERGKPIVPASAKNQAAMFFVEHLIGKPTQRVEQDISVKLQGILGVAMVNPSDALASPEQGGNGMNLAHLPGATIPIGPGGLVEGQVMDEEDDLDD